MSDTEAVAVHHIKADKGTTSCCGRTPFELPSWERITNDPELCTCVESSLRGE